MSDRQGSGGAVFAAFVLGAVAGAAVALLYAPAAGEETRGRVGQRVREGRDRASEALREGRRRFEEERANLKQSVQKARETFTGDEGDFGA